MGIRFEVGRVSVPVAGLGFLKVQRNSWAPVFFGFSPGGRIGVFERPLSPTAKLKVSAGFSPGGRIGVFESLMWHDAFELLRSCFSPGGRIGVFESLKNNPVVEIVTVSVPVAGLGFLKVRVVKPLLCLY